MATGLNIGGKIFPVLHPVTGHPIPVLGPEDHKVEFRPGDGFNKKRFKPIDLGVFHWTGAENSVETMVETLRQRKLGVEFAISPHGVIYQFCDPIVVDTADAGIANSRSWGVEIVNAGFRRMSTLWREPQYRKPPMGPRTVRTVTMHGSPVTIYDFYPAQKMAAFALNKTITQAIPTYSTDVCRANTVVEISRIKGAIGHFQITTEKYDPGLPFMLELSKFMSEQLIV
jgi:hypothetical protein